MNMRPVAERILATFQRTLFLGEHDPKPSSFWNEQMVMLSDEELPLDLRMYGQWHEYTERFVNGWMLYAPYHVFRACSEDFFVLGHRKQEWLVYDTTNKTTKKIRGGHQLLDTYPSFFTAIQAIGDESRESSL